MKLSPVAPAADMLGAPHARFSPYCYSVFLMCLEAFRSAGSHGGKLSLS
jgi:hypothetical protein